MENDQFYRISEDSIISLNGIELEKLIFKKFNPKCGIISKDKKIRIDGKLIKLVKFD